MKNKLKSLAALWLALVLALTMVMPIGAVKHDVLVYTGDDALIKDNNYNNYPPSLFNMHMDYDMDAPTPINQLDLSYADVSAWKIWQIDACGSLYYVVDEIPGNASLPEWWTSYYYLLEPTNVIRAFTKQPTSADPSVAVNVPTGASYQWYDLYGSVTLTGADVFLYVGSYNGGAFVPDQGTNTNSLDIGQISAHAGARIKVTPTSDDSNCDFSIYDWHTSVPYTKEGDSYYFDVTQTRDNYNVCIEAACDFTATIEIIVAPVSGETSPTLSAVESDKDYYCVVTWADGYSLVSDTLSEGDSNASLRGGANCGIIMVLLAMRRMRYYDGDEMVGWQKVTHGEILAPLALDNKDGMMLEGWYTDEELTEKFDFTLPVHYGTKLFAKWVEIPEEPVDPEEPEAPEEPADTVAAEEVVEPAETTEVTDEPANA